MTCESQTQFKYQLSNNLKIHPMKSMLDLFKTKDISVEKHRLMNEIKRCRTQIYEKKKIFNHSLQRSKSETRP